MALPFTFCPVRKRCLDTLYRSVYLLCMLCSMWKFEHTEEEREKERGERKKNRWSHVSPQNTTTLNYIYITIDHYCLSRAKLLHFFDFNVNIYYSNVLSKSIRGYVPFLFFDKHSTGNSRKHRWGAGTGVHCNKIIWRWRSTYIKYVDSRQWCLALYARVCEWVSVFFSSSILIRRCPFEWFVTKFPLYFPPC